MKDIRLHNKKGETSPKVIKYIYKLAPLSPGIPLKTGSTRNEGTSQQRLPQSVSVYGLT